MAAASRIFVSFARVTPNLTQSGFDLAFAARAMSATTSSDT
eukprot:CAMPEP_0172442676 /NCGR_PEP_ID=MMETSP1065-20121228/3077_1 /TAXON_ID=265537 /ORGANISM="Amphiprora paludosa, Strain CCMP125" /LENGTH=40 /DNA_ID= /DNA_START= /DNA_END= /DNA_ORIENTATION=